MGERSLLFRALHEHRDRRSNALIDEHHEYLVLVAKKNRAAAASRSMARTCTSTTGLLILLVSSLAFPPRSELLSTGDQEPKPSRFAPHPCQKFDPLEFQVTVQRACVFARRTYTLE
jgi:hypothetical protein